MSLVEFQEDRPQPPMPRIGPKIGFDVTTPPFDQLEGIQRLATDRRGDVAVETARHQLYVGNDKKNDETVLIKIASRPGLTYQDNVANEIASLSRINELLPQSPYFPVIKQHGKLGDGRVYMIASFFFEFPLATVIGRERIPGKTAANIRTSLEIARALEEIHGLEIYHVDLNPMNILRRVGHGGPIIRIVDFESSYDASRHSAGVFYNPPTTPGYSAPEISSQAPDARADIFSLGAVLYTMLAGVEWTWKADVGTSVSDDRDLDPEIRAILLQAVASHPNERYQSMEEFRSRLAGYLEGHSVGRG